MAAVKAVEYGAHQVRGAWTDLVTQRAFLEDCRALLNVLR